MYPFRARLAAILVALLPTVAAAQYSIRPVSDYFQADGRWVGAGPDVALERGIRQLVNVSRRMEQVASVSPRLFVSDNPTINAFATDQDGIDVVVFNRGLLDVLGGDPDKTAMVYGHELAHLKARHLQQESFRNSIIHVVAGFLVAAIDERAKGKLGPALLGRVAAELGAKATSRAFGRSDEVEADEMGLRWMAAAGFRPEAGIQFFKSLAKSGDRRVFDLFATHPAWEDRFAASELVAVELSRSSVRSVSAAPSVATMEPDRWVMLGGQQISLQRVRALADDGDGNAKFLTALMLLEGRGMNRNIPIARTMLRDAWRKGVTDAGTIDALLDLASPDTTSSAILFLAEQAGKGDPFCQFAYGSFLSGRAKTANELELALKYLNESASRGTQLAKVTAGALRLAKGGAAGEVGEALAQIAEAADAGSPTGQVTYGILLAVGGHNIPKDQDRAYRYLRRAADQGGVLASLAAGVMQAEGKGTALSEAAALTDLTRASRAGNRAATIYLEALQARQHGDSVAFAEGRARALNAYRETIVEEMNRVSRREAAVVATGFIDAAARRAAGEVSARSK